MKKRLTQAERLRRYPLSMDARIGAAHLMLLCKCGPAGKPRADEILARRGVEGTLDVPLADRQALLDEFVAEIQKLRPGLPPEMQREITRLEPYYLKSRSSTASRRR